MVSRCCIITPGKELFYFPVQSLASHGRWSRAIFMMCVYLGSSVPWWKMSSLDRLTLLHIYSTCPICSHYMHN